MNITNINLTKSAQIFTIKKKLTKESINAFFRKLKKEGNFLLKETKKNITTANGVNAQYSIAVYKNHEEPSFLTNTSLLELKYCFILFIEIDDSLVVYKKNSESPEMKLKNYIEEYDYNKLCHFKGNDSPDYEKVSMNNMSLSNAVVRSRSYEAFRLNGIISNITTSRAIPRNFRMKVKDKIYTLTPNTCRITLKDKKTTLNDIVDWSKELIASVNAGSKSEFISNFASPITLKEITDQGIDVSAIFIGLSDLEEDVLGSNQIKILKFDNQDIPDKKIKQLFRVFRSCLSIKHKTWVGTKFKKHIRIALTVKSISLRSKLLDKISIKDITSHETLSLTQYINSNRLLSAVFTNPNYSYWASTCFEDKKLLNNLDNFLSYLSDSYDFNGVLSEKEKGDNGKYPDNLRSFPNTSLFYKIEEFFDNNNSIVICDDMGDEWADHIIIDNNKTSPSILFIHEKFTKKDSSGAGAFHEVVSQALKNIGRLYEPISSFKEKYNNKWKDNYENTDIKRIKKGEKWDDIEKALLTLNQSTLTTRQIVLATPFLDKDKIKKEFDKLKLKQPPKLKPYHIQLIWLLSTLISTCQDQGIKVTILCK